MEYNSKIGISIPAYRRPELLKGCLLSAIESCAEYKVPIFISDDSCSDINDECIEYVKQLYPYIFHNKNKVNLGIDGNIIKSINDCKCEYVWIIGEDDKFCNSAFRELISIVEDYSWEFIYVNYSYVSNDYSKIIRHKRIENLPVVLSGEEFFEKYIWAIGFIGACIVKKASWEEIRSEKYVGTYFAHVGVVAEIIHGKKVKIVESPQILNRAEDVSSTTWSQYSFEVNYGWDKLIQLLRPIYGLSSISLAKKNSSNVFWHRSIIFLISKRADSIYNFQKFKTFILSNEFNFLYKICAFLISFLPSIIPRLVKNCYKKLD